MSVSDNIKVGDIVDVDFIASTSLVNQTVVYIPVATGDCWILKSQCGEISAVQLFEIMRKKEVKA